MITKLIARLLGLRLFYEDMYNYYFYSKDESFAFTITCIGKQEFSAKQLALSPTQFNVITQFERTGEYDVKTATEDREFGVPVKEIPIAYTIEGWDLLSVHEGYLKNYSLSKTFSGALHLARIVYLKDELLGTNQFTLTQEMAKQLVTTIYKHIFGKNSKEFMDYLERGEMENGN